MEGRHRGPPLPPLLSAAAAELEHGREIAAERHGHRDGRPQAAPELKAVL